MKKKHLIKNIALFICLIFMCSYVVSKSGYYEYSMQSKKNLTDIEIKRFESDIKEGKYVDITDYLKEKQTDYTSPLTRITIKISRNINNYLKEGLESMFNIVGKLVED